VQHVASRASAYHSRHHAIDPRGAHPASDSKPLSTPFSVLLDEMPEESPTPPGKQQSEAKAGESAQAPAPGPERNDQTQARAGQDQEPKAAGGPTPILDAEHSTAATPQERIANPSENPVIPTDPDEKNEADKEVEAKSSGSPDPAPATIAAAPATAQPFQQPPAMPTPLLPIVASPSAAEPTDDGDLDGATPAASVTAPPYRPNAGAMADRAQAAISANPPSADSPNSEAETEARPGLAKTGPTTSTTKAGAASSPKQGSTTPDQKAPDQATPETGSDPGQATATAGLKADQSTALKGKATGPKPPASRSDSKALSPDGAMSTADTGETADSVEAPQPTGKANAPSVAPEQDKPARPLVHETAGRSETRSVHEPATASSQPAAPDGTSQSKPPDGGQIPTLQQQTDRTGSAAAPATSTPGNAPTSIPLAGLGIAIATRAQAGHNRFEIRLDPSELGRIHVHLDVDKSGHVTSHLVVDRVETLDALRRDAAGLERALQQAGLKTSENGMQFTLRDQSFAGRDDRPTPANAARVVVSDPDLAPIEATPVSYGRLLRTAGGVDIRV
jgi:hypothetical protein